MMPAMENDIMLCSQETRLGVSLYDIDLLAGKTSCLPSHRIIRLTQDPASHITRKEFSSHTIFFLENSDVVLYLLRSYYVRLWFLSAVLIVINFGGNYI